MTDNAFSIMFVDDDTRILDGLRRQFYGKGKSWSIRFVESATAALDAMDEQPADVVISDMQMPMMTGAELLKEIQSRWPQTIRIILSAQTDQSELLRHIGAIHQFLQKPCTPEVIIQSIDRLDKLSSTIMRDDLKALTCGLEVLPVVSATYAELITLLNDECSHLDDIAKIVEQDVGLCTKLMQFVNSAFFGLPRKVTTAKSAISIVGLKHLEAFVLSSNVMEALTNPNSKGGSIERLWSASIHIATHAASTADELGARTEVIDSARLAGMLSMVGRAILIHSMPDRYEKVKRSAKESLCTLTQAEVAEFGVSQQSVGAYALGLWAFSDEVVHAVAYQENPETSNVLALDHPLPYLHLARSQTQPAELIDPILLAEGWIEEVSGTSTNSTNLKDAA